MIGERLKEIRNGKGLTQKAFADILSTSSGYISEIENNKNAPGNALLVSLKRNFGVSIDWLLTGDGSPYIGESGGTDIEEGPPPTTNVVELRHMELVRGFQDKQRAFDINRELMELEKLDPEIFKRVGSYIKGAVDTIRAVAERSAPYGSDRRQGERRIDGETSENPNGNDRRSGLDRRKATGGPH